MRDSQDPPNLYSWLGEVDTNGLRDDEANAIAGYDIEDDAQLESLVENWLRPRFLQNNEVSRRSLRALLTEASHWSDDDLRPAFDDVLTPSGQTIKDIRRFLNALKKAAREE